MTKPVLFMPAARLELIEARDWYDRMLSGLGQRFLDQVDVQIGRIEAHPLQFPVMWRDVRRVRVARFPYGLFFRILPDVQYVIAIFHSSRDPTIWRGRI